MTVSLRQRRASLCLCALILSACASTRPPESSPAYWTGRLALQVQSEPPQQWSAGFQLQGSPEQGEMLLLSPIGTTLARLSWTPQSAQLEQGGRVTRGDNLSSLSAQLQGKALPIAALFDWLAGRPSEVPGWQVDLSDHAQGRLLAQRSFPAPAAVLRIVLER
ncbi:MAG: lipoprotein insertase outer membrane protein LolB [Limnohabitans sp.]